MDDRSIPYAEEFAKSRRNRSDETFVYAALGAVLVAPFLAMYLASALY